jgi:NhaA family Na+:H+ antiporter
MAANELDESNIDKWIINPVNHFISKSTTGGIVLFVCAIIAIVLSNSPYGDWYHAIWKHEIGLKVDNFNFSNSFHHWINDGLMAVFFFVVGLELKREVMGGQLKSIKVAILPIFAALGGMIVPAFIYFLFNYNLPSISGWGIPMATDIAFALGILYLLGAKVPASLKVFLATLAIADDIGAVLVIAFFYTSDISFLHLGIGAAILTVLTIANLIGVRNSAFYGIFGLGVLWLTFLPSGIHATLAGVLVAFTIPSDVKLRKDIFINKIISLTRAFAKTHTENSKMITDEQLHLLEDIKKTTLRANSPLQKILHHLHPYVTFIILPLFALSNAGITVEKSLFSTLFTPVALGVFLGLFVGKFLGVYLSTNLLLKLKIAKLPDDISRHQLMGLSLLAGIGFTMSLFVSNLAFVNPDYIAEAKVGILFGSLLSGILGFIILNNKRKN